MTLCIYVLRLRARINLSHESLNAQRLPARVDALPMHPPYDRLRGHAGAIPVGKLQALRVMVTLLRTTVKGGMVGSLVALCVPGCKIIPIALVGCSPVEQKCGKNVTV